MDYRRLEVSQKAHQMTIWVYKITREPEWPKEELYGLTSQVRRAAVSVEANLAEGQARTGSAEFAHFVSLACGSAAELECEMLIALDLGYILPEIHEEFAMRVDQVRRMLIALRVRLTSHASRPTPGAQR